KKKDGKTMCEKLITTDRDVCLWLIALNAHCTSRKASRDSAPKHENSPIIYSPSCQWSPHNTYGDPRGEEVATKLHLMEAYGAPDSNVQKHIIETTEYVSRNPPLGGVVLLPPLPLDLCK
ncbi:hypothetical protein R7D93_25285, partial [Vibrio sp. YT-15]|uniref:hypothetical protein n=1 Tax=Vibrio sp. YT-15 TaxID=3074706 RepID=UPI0029648864